ncbi:MAG: hypothetical protein JXR13_08895 [Thalassovita sp.]
MAGPAVSGPLPAPLGDADFVEFDPAQAELGRLLFYDKILSGNRNISCATCHHPTLGTSDGLSLGLGEGGVGLGPDRVSETGRDRIKKRVPRNAPALWNLGAREVHTVMHDGRISVDNVYGNGFNTPAEEWLPSGLNSLLAVQALFPLTSETEMAGDPEENEIGGATNDRIDNVWPIVSKRVRTLPEYGQKFVDAFEHIERADQVTIVEIANALAAFMVQDFTSVDTPFDAYLAGDQDALNAQQHVGMELFFGKANCASCHAGSLLSDQKFHALGLPAFGPGRTRRFDPIVRDVGRLGESDALEDAYRFRTPMLRNVALTGPYGHNGAFPTLMGMLRHHVDPEASRQAWTRQTPVLPDLPWLREVDFVVQNDRLELARQARVRDVYLPQLTEAELQDIEAFLHALTGAKAALAQSEIPQTVPSGLPVDGREIHD